MDAYRFHRIEKYLFVLSVILFSSSFLKCEDQPEAEITDNTLDDFKKWFESSGGNCNCEFVHKDGEVAILATKDIFAKGPIIEIPESLVLTTNIASKFLGSVMDDLSSGMQSDLPDQEKYLSHLKMALFLVDAHIRQDPSWYPYTKLINRKQCDALWLWSKDELNELQDEKLAEMAVSIRTFFDTALDKNLIGSDVTKEKVINFLCHVNTRSLHVSVDGTTQEALIPVVDMLSMKLEISTKIREKDGPLHFMYRKKNLHAKQEIFLNPGHKLTTPQVLLQHGILLAESEGKFLDTTITGTDSRAHKSLVKALNIKTFMIFVEKFTYKHAAFPYFRIRALKYETAKKFLENTKDAQQLAFLKKIFNSPALQLDDTPVHSCKDEVIALNTLAAYFKVKFTDLPTRITDDVKILKDADISKRKKLAVLYRKQLKSFLGIYYERCGSRAIELKRKCLSKRLKDEL